MPQWKWTIYDNNELDKLLYEYLKSCKRIKESIVQAIEAFYLPYALKHIGAPPLEVQKAYQRSIDTLQSRVRIMALDAGVAIEGYVDTAVKQSPSSLDPIQIAEDDRGDEVDKEPPIQPRKRMMELED